MTTLLADTKRRILVTDSLITAPGVGEYRTTKLYRAGKSIFGECGDVTAYMRFRRWQLDGALRRDRPKFTELDDFAILELASDGLFMWDWTLAREVVDEPFYAVGTGSKAALYCALVLGYAAERAVAEACKVDIHSAIPVKVIELKSDDGPRTVEFDQ